MKKKLLTFLLLFTFISQSASAAVLGSVITAWWHDIAESTQLYSNVYLSEQSGVGKQTDYYAEYKPNTDVLPKVINGSSIWGLRDIKEAEQYMKENGMTPMIGINASFFSFKTGIPMGHVISEGRILSKDTLSYPSIGFNSDGTAFIAPLSITTSIFAGDTVIDVAHINKYNQSEIDILNLYTDDFDVHNHSDLTSLNVILGNVDGNLGIGDTITATVEEKFVYTGAIKIPEGKILLTLNDFAPTELYAKLDSLEIGTEIQISSYANDERWNYVQSGLGSEGKQLVVNGVVQTEFEKGAAPRTAVGITESGSVIFYVIDGRQPGHSYGVQQKTLAKRMGELGCVDAINLDGGGSTAISGIYPGSDENSVLNSPSEGVLRNCTNYIFLQNMREPTGELNKLYMYPFEQHYLSGYSEQIQPAAVDTAYYKTDLPAEISYKIDSTESIINTNGVLTAKGDGMFTVTASGGGAEGTANYYTYESPTNVNVYNAETNSEIKSLNLKKDDVVPMSFASQSYYIDLKTSPDCFNYEVTNNLGYVQDGNLVITANGGSGVLKISAGNYTKEIPINVKFESVFYDINNHWAADMINTIYEENIISGYQTNRGYEFRPDNDITREEFAVIMCRFLDINSDEFADIELDFADKNVVSSWARNSVAAMQQYKIISGKSDGNKTNFAPADNLTRAEAMTILGRVLEGEGDNSISFKDSADIPEWAIKNIKLMVSRGFVNGYEDNTIRPNGKVTRAEAVTMLYKIMNTSF